MVMPRGKHSKPYLVISVPTNNTCTVKSQDSNRDLVDRAFPLTRYTNLLSVVVSSSSSSSSSNSSSSSSSSSIITITIITLYCCYYKTLRHAQPTSSSSFFLPETIGPHISPRDLSVQEQPRKITGLMDSIHYLASEGTYIPLPCPKQNAVASWKRVLVNTVQYHTPSFAERGKPR